MAIDNERRDIIVAALGQSTLQALVCSSPTDVLLLTGYWPVMGLSVAFIDRDGKRVVVVPEDEIDLARATSDAELLPYKPHSLNTLKNVSDLLAEPVQEVLSSLGVGAGPVGVELRDGIQPASYQASNRFRESIVSLLSDRFGKASVVSADKMLDRLKSIKTRVELDQIRRAATLASTGFEEAGKAISPGRREDEVASDIEAAFARHAMEGFERGGGYFFCMSGPNSTKAAAAYARTRRRTIESGDLVMIHANTVGDGYWTDITRTYIAGGTPSERQQHMQRAITEGRSAALKAIAPGAPASGVDQAARDVLADYGLAAEFKHATGHGVGFAAVNPDALPRIHPLSPDVLEAGMTFNIEPAIYIEGLGGMRHCDLIACTAAGAEVLTDF